MMSDTHEAERRFGLLLTKLLEGSTTPEEAEWIAGRLRSSAAARKYYHDYVETHAILRWEHGASDESLTLGALDRLFNERREDDCPVDADDGGPSFNWLEIHTHRGRFLRGCFSVRFSPWPFSRF